MNILAGSLIPTPIYMFKAYFLDVCVSVTNSPWYIWILDSPFRCEFIFLDSGNACWGCCLGSDQSQTLPALLPPCLARSSRTICKHWRFFISFISPKAAISTTESWGIYDSGVLLLSSEDTCILLLRSNCSIN